jgi:8-oxo-dGTP pyrophosphatase MutT (NUDIX family)
MSDKVIRRGPWQQLSSERVYENRWIAVDHQAVITPGGTEGIYGLVHFKNIALGIIPIDADGNTRLVGQFRYALDEYSWEIPMGGGALACDPLQSAQRELQEETGLKGGRWQQLLKLHTSNSVTDELALVYLAFDLQQGEQALEDSESDLQVKVLPFEEAVAMACAGEISDAISVAGLLAAQRYFAS